jgi:hypothetical protein
VTTQPPSPDAKLLTFTQTARRMGVGVQTVQGWARTEQCPIVRDSRGRKRVPAGWVADPAGWLR